MVWKSGFKIASSSGSKDMSDQDNEKRRYWFPAQRYGWGWGLPSTWQGWVTVIIYMGSVMVGAFIFAREQKFLFISLTAILSLIFIVVCWIKGEPPRWRWGKDKSA